MRISLDQYLLLSLTACTAYGGTVRGTAKRASDQESRQLHGSSGFSRLSCNDEIVFCENWSQQAFDPANQEVVIPCNKCISLDVSGTITLAHGLDIQGKLQIPDGVIADIHTPYVLVQGELEMNSKRATSAEPDIKFILTGDSEVQKSPHAENSHMCNSGPCNFGVKPIAVAGGVITAQGLMDSCPSWTSLISANSIAAPDDIGVPTYVAPVAGCSDDIISTDFEGSTGISWPNGWYRNYGGTDSYQVDTDGNTYALYGGRTSTWNGPQTNFDASCIVPGVTYFIQAKARLTKPGSVSNCQLYGNNCLKLTTFLEDSDVGRRWNNRGAGGQHNDGEWFDFLSTMKFLEKDADTATQIARRFYWEGPEAGVEIALDDVRIFRAPASSFPDPNDVGGVCNELLINGDAEDTFFGKIAYPVSTMHPARIQVDTEADGNRYFRTTDRQVIWGTPKWELTPGCVVEDSIYSFSVDIRMHSSASKQKLRWELHAKDEASGTQDWKWLVICPEQDASDGWVTCSVDWQFTEFQAAASYIRLYAVSFTDGYTDTVNDIDFDNFSLSFKSGPVLSLTLPDPDGSIASCWGEGSEILVTPNTLTFTDVTTRSITSVSPNSADQTVTIELDQPMTTTSTLSSDPDYVVEVALLSRNIAFESADTEISKGGHLIVHHTMRAQSLDGLSFKRFGQQGTLGRYPVHFHMCGSSLGSVVSRNVVRQSNQRCYVIHGTHNVTLDSNIGYDTSGHCFMLEDHAERDNVFRSNLASVTRKVQVKIREEETDEFPSSFWISNPENTFIGNVAAGSEHSGFWFEMKDSVRGPSKMVMNPDGSLMNEGYKPFEAPLTLFKSNIAHSNYEHGIKTYPGRGYEPVGDAAVFQDTKSYRNRGSGVFIHNSRNIRVVGGLFADNRVQIDVDRSPSCDVDSARIVGYSPSYQFYKSTLSAIGHCPSSYPIRGVEVHTYWVGGTKNSGTTITNTTFENFGNTGCADSSAIRVDTENKGYFDIRSAVSGATFDADTAPLNACDAKDAGITNFAMRDLDGSIMGSPGFIVMDTPQMTTFPVCVSDIASCTAFCAGQCLRTMAVSVSTFEDDNLVLEVTDVNSGQTVSITANYDYPFNSDGSINMAEHTKSHRSRLFFAVLPSGGEYTAKFTLNGADHWPVYVKTDYDDPDSDCPEFTSFTIETPADESCTELIRNGDMEAGVDNWWATMGGVVSVDESASGQGLALTSEYRSAWWMGPAQYLDSRCMSQGSAYLVTAKVKMVSASTGAPVSCSMTPEYRCPKMILYLDSGAHEDRDQHWHWAGQVHNDWVVGDWNTLSGSITVQPHFAGLRSFLVYFEAKEVDDALIVIDDVSIVLE